MAAAASAADRDRECPNMESVGHTKSNHGAFFRSSKNDGNVFLWKIAFKRRILAKITDFLYADEVHHLLGTSRILHNGSIQVEGLFRRSLWKNGLTTGNRHRFWLWALTPSPVIDCKPSMNSKLRQTSLGASQWTSESVKTWAKRMQYTRRLLINWDWAGIRPTPQRRRMDMEEEADDESRERKDPTKDVWPVFVPSRLRKKSGIHGEVYRDSERTMPECSIFSESSLESLRNVLGNQAGSGNFQVIYLPGLPALWACLVVFHTVLCPDVGYCQGMNQLTAMLLLSIRRSRIARDNKKSVMFVPENCFHVSDVISACAILKALADQHGAKECWGQHLPRLCSFGYMISRLFRHHLPEQLAASLAKSSYSPEMLAAAWLLPLLSNYLPLHSWERLMDCFCGESWLAIFKVLAACLDKLWRDLCSNDPAEISDFLKEWRETSGQLTLAQVSGHHFRRFVRKEQLDKFAVLLRPNVLMRDAYRIGLTYPLLQKWEHDNAVEIISARISKMVPIDHDNETKGGSITTSPRSHFSPGATHSSFEYQQRTLAELPIVPPIPKPVTHFSSWHYWPREHISSSFRSKKSVDPSAFDTFSSHSTSSRRIGSGKSLYSKLQNRRLNNSNSAYGLVGTPRKQIISKIESSLKDGHSQPVNEESINISNERWINDSLHSLCEKIHSIESPIHQDVSEMMRKIDTAVRKLHETSEYLSSALDQKNQSQDKLWTLLQEKRDLKEKLRNLSMGGEDVDVESARKRVQTLGKNISELDTLIHEASAKWKADMWKYTLAETDRNEAVERVNALRQQLVSLLLESHKSQRHLILETWRNLVDSSSYSSL